MLPPMWAGVLAVASLLLVAAGLVKIADPGGTVEVLTALGLPVGATAVRLGAGAEALVGGAALVLTGPLWAGAVALSYVGFAAVVTASRRNPGAADCGCFGRRGAPPSLRHAVVDLAVAAGCVLAAVTGAPSTAHLLVHNPRWGVPFAAVVVVGAALGSLVLSNPALRPSEAQR